MLFRSVHPIGQGARAVTMVQIVFDLLVVGVLVAVATQRLELRAARRGVHHPEGD